MASVFISYSRNDSGFADQLTRALDEHGFSAWVDRDNIEGGDMWRAAISRAIASCDAFLVVLSPECINSKNVVKELSIADSNDRPILPIVYKKCKIPPEMDYQLAGLQWIEFEGRAFEEALSFLVKALQARLKLTNSDPQSRSPDSPPPVAPTDPSRCSPSGVQTDTDGGAMPAAPNAPPGYQMPQPGVASNLPPALGQMIPGRWDIQVGAAYVGQVARLCLDIYPNGVFNGQVMSQMGASAIAGQWQISPTGQLVLQGRQQLGWNVAPYIAVVTFNQVTPGMLAGLTAAGEQVVWNRLA